MPEISVRIPAIGEGLQEARIVAFLKNPGDTVKRDEYIYQMETDKAVMDVESPHAGTLVKWLVSVDDVVPIGAEVLVMETGEGQTSRETKTETKVENQAEVAPAVNPSSENHQIALKIPQIGEGIQEARLIAKLKEPGQSFKRDEIIYQMETDKAVMDVESPYKGTVVKWLAEVDDLVPVGGDVLLIETSEATASADQKEITTPQQSQPQLQTGATKSNSTRRRDLPPKSRAYAKEKGLSDEDIASLPSTGKNLLLADIDSYLATGTTPTKSQSTGGKVFSEQAMPSKQRILSSRMARGSKLVVPGMMSVVCNWGELESLRAEIKASEAEFQPSSFTMFAYAVARAASDHPIMRSTLVGDDTIRTYENLQLGIAVALPEDQLAVAVVEDSSSLDWKSFADQARDKIDQAREGKDQANESVTLSITNMQAYGIREAMAVVVPPGVATIFLGEPYNGLAQETNELKIQRCANIGITIDHRLINGVGGAEFLQAIKSNVENIRGLCRT